MRPIWFTYPYACCVHYAIHHPPLSATWWLPCVRENAHVPWLRILRLALLFHVLVLVLDIVGDVAPDMFHVVNPVRPFVGCLAENDLVPDCFPWRGAIAGFVVL